MARLINIHRFNPPQKFTLHFQNEDLVHNANLRTLANMAVALKILLSRIDLLIFTLLGIFIVVYGTVALSLPNTKTAGILTLIVDISLPLFLY
jgi:hypothetical protein